MNAAIDRANAHDLDAVLALLGEVNLPIEGVAEHFGDFFIARNGEQLVGCVGQERYGRVALLRSLAVSPALQRSGLGKELTACLLDEARGNGVREMVLLTTTAASPEWHLPSCSSAVCMYFLRLSE